MAQTVAYVVQHQGDGLALVVAEKGQGCSSCGAAVSCHGGRAAAARQTPALNRIGAKVGDRVVLTVASGTLLSRLALLYLLPVALLMTGAFWGAALDGGRGAFSGHSVGYGLGGFILGFGLSIATSRIWCKARPVIPVISRILPSHPLHVDSAPASTCGHSVR